MDCWWCHNPESRRREPQEVQYLRKLGEKEINSTKVYGKVLAVQQVVREILKDKLFFEESGGGVTFSGGEPLYQPDALFELLKLCYRHGLHTAVDTCGYAQWKVIERILPYTDLFLFDLKIMSREKHIKYTVVSNDLILYNLERLIATKGTVELRIPMVPGVNTDASELGLFLDFLQDKTGKISKVHLLPYHEIGNNKYQKLNEENRMRDMLVDEHVPVESFKKQIETIGFEVGIGG
jgi:pyruvate formate lyase activating enzyme